MPLATIAGLTDSALTPGSRWPIADERARDGYVNSNWRRSRDFPILVAPRPNPSAPHRESGIQSALPRSYLEKLVAGHI